MLDVSTDFEVFDGKETVTYRSVTNAGGTVGGGKTEAYESISVAGVLRHVLRPRELLLGGASEVDADIVFNVPAANLQTLARGQFSPTLLDQIVDAQGLVYRVIRWEYATRLSRWRIFTRRPE